MRTSVLWAAVTAVAVYGCATGTGAPGPGAPRPTGADTGASPKAEPTADTLFMPLTTPVCSSSGLNIDDCVIEIQVADSKVESGKCDITLVDPNSDLITSGKVQGKFVYWRIVGTADYIFTEDDGVVFVDNFRPRGFAKGKRLADKQIFRWKNLNNGPKVYAYVINAVKQDDSRECFLDPWYRNT